MNSVEAAIFPHGPLGPPEYLGCVRRRIIVLRWRFGLDQLLEQRLNVGKSGQYFFGHFIVLVKYVSVELEIYNCRQSTQPISTRYLVLSLVTLDLVLGLSAVQFVFKFGFQTALEA